MRGKGIYVSNAYNAFFIVSSWNTFCTLFLNDDKDEIDEIPSLEIFVVEKHCFIIS